MGGTVAEDAAATVIRRADGASAADTGEVAGGPRTVGWPSLADAVRRFRAAAADDRVTGVAAEVAFFGFLGIFPGLLALAAALGFLEVLVGADVADRAQRVVVDFLSGFLGERATATVDSVEALFEETDVALLSFASVGALWSVWRAARATVRALGVVYDVQETRSAARVAAVALVVAVSTLVLAAVMLVMFIVGPLLGGGRAVAATVGLGDVFAALWTWARLPLGFVVLVGWAAMLFRLTPDRTSTLRDELPGAVATGLLWLLFSAGFQVYLRVAGGANHVLGVIGGVMTVLVWLYLLSLALLVGAEMNAVITTGRATGRRWGPHDGRTIAPPIGPVSRPALTDRPVRPDSAGVDG
jgi:membrane protein